MKPSRFKNLLSTLQDLTPTQKRYLINQTKLALEDEPNNMSPNEILTREELDALLQPPPEIHTK
ncbi:hypothetical protein AK966_06960 [Vibrio sp. PID23_8]|jgi:hypothetical protein|uniref:hypothetical protein n=1 Tax=Vibrio sp. PID17_43 TaxID=1583451 RepID=UPI000BFFCBB3|nr:MULTISPECIES: hypothetical protein [unclassified Vibrio]PHJ43528.1 hypothetical protein AK965_00865 [Vibrio sp. PID17_43]RIZ55077.1 hypothetical protein AK966_06960 [Vibrio sp. PID23_8]